MRGDVPLEILQINKLQNARETQLQFQLKDTKIPEEDEEKVGPDHTQLQRCSGINNRSLPEDMQQQEDAENGTHEERIGRTANDVNEGPILHIHQEKVPTKRWGLYRIITWSRSA